MKPTAPCSGVHGPPTEVTLPLGTWHSRELLGIHCQSVSKADLGEGQRERIKGTTQVTDTHRLEEPGTSQLGRS